LKQKVEMSNAREDGDREKYNEIKEEQATQRFQRFNHTETADEFVQCFLKVGSKLYWDAIDLPSNLVKMMREDRKISKQNWFTHTNERVNRSQYKLISYLDMFKSPIKNLLKTCWEIKIVDQTKKTLAILSNNEFIANKI
jgi:hypothetical protein